MGRTPSGRPRLGCLGRRRRRRRSRLAAPGPRRHARELDEGERADEDGDNNAIRLRDLSSRACVESVRRCAILPFAPNMPRMAKTRFDSFFIASIFFPSPIQLSAGAPPRDAGSARRTASYSRNCARPRPRPRALPRGGRGGRCEESRTEGTRLDNNILYFLKLSGGGRGRGSMTGV